MNKSIFYDEKSRYNDVDNTNIVFVTPKQVLDLDIGIENTWREDEMDSEFPFLVDVLKEMVKETTIGASNGSEIQLAVEDSDAKVVFCVEIHGKLCKLQREEWDFTHPFSGITIDRQPKLFQRLLKDGQITFDDLAAEDISNSVYKKLVANDIDGARIYVQKCNIIDSWMENQKDNKKYIKRKNAILNA